MPSPLPEKYAKMTVLDATADRKKIAENIVANFRHGFKCFARAWNSLICAYCGFFKPEFLRKARMSRSFQQFGSPLYRRRADDYTRNQRRTSWNYTAHLKPRVVFQKKQKSLPDHTRCADYGNFVLFHNKNLFKDKKQRGCAVIPVFRQFSATSRPA